ncbi:jg23909 [Pararge aegeria aegeria]|uniref:Jg23909 protein n=1 Tax=Pararge aegeria aegeria TaxID=348720 RepID=A0A8S4S6E6_9NEOP|nr:jg23909 [Pararge aegeria aegeria]
MGGAHSSESLDPKMLEWRSYIGKGSLSRPRRGDQMTSSGPQGSAGSRQTIVFGTSYIRPLSSSGRPVVDVVMIIYRHSVYNLKAMDAFKLSFMQSVAAIDCYASLAITGSSRK